jgi:BirA family biotin operon repressor/biotin-[acetyl-CoA-carboxylase] ligase
VIDAKLQAGLEQLCKNGSIQTDGFIGTESSLLAALTTLGISYRQANQRLELESPLTLINPQAVKSYIAEAGLLDGFEWQYRLLTESTNAAVLQLFESSGKPCVAFAEMQSAGRGRRGRQWHSPFARNIICTIGMHKSVEGCNPGLLSIVTGLALIEALENAGIVGVQLKWPNDLYYQNKKLGGILIESKMITNQAYFFAIGFGINVMMNAEEMSAIPQPVTSIDSITENPVSRDRLLAESIRQVVTAVNEFDQASVPEVIDSFLAKDAFKNQTISVNHANEAIEGQNLGINSDGQLKVETEQGIQIFSAGDISIKRVT